MEITVLTFLMEKKSTRKLFGMSIFFLDSAKNCRLNIVLIVVFVL